jgi:type I restriction enzyme S subunit
VSASVDRVRPWSGELPRGWGATPLGYLVRTVGGSTPSKDEPAFWNGDIPWVTPKDMKRDVLSDSQDHVSVLATLSLRVLQPPVVLTVVRGMILAHTVPVATTAAPVTINQDMKALLPGASLSTGYLAWTLRAFQDGLLALVETAGHGTCKLSTELWRKFLIPVPPVAAQRAIASFLDRKTAAIDALIEKKERLIALLEEKRQALITQAVTKGLDPSVTMKDSGIEWLGEIPAHWSTPPLYATHTVQLGKMLNSEAISGDEHYPYLRNQDVQWGSFRLQDLPTMSFGVAERSKFALLDGDLLVCEGGDVGRSAIWRHGSGSFFYQKALHRVRRRAGEQEPEFLYYCMWTAARRGAFLEGGNKSTIVHLTAEKLRGHRFPTMPTREQREIAGFAAEVDARTDIGVTTNRRAIELLREYRQALITAAVTGQLDISTSSSAET